MSSVEFPSYLRSRIPKEYIAQSAVVRTSSMKFSLFLQILLVWSLLALTVPVNTFHVFAAPSYGAGVKSGDIMIYENVTSFWQSNSTQSPILEQGLLSSLNPPLIVLPAVSSSPNATISVRPNATVDLSRSMEQITVELALNNTPDVPPFNSVSVVLSYDPHVLTASSLDYSTNVFTQTSYPQAVIRNCLDGQGAGGQSNLCQPDDGLGITSFGESILGGVTPDGTQGSIFFLTFNVNTTVPSFSQILIKQAILAYGSTSIPITTLNGSYSSLNCGGQVCPPPPPPPPPAQPPPFIAEFLHVQSIRLLVESVSSGNIISALELLTFNNGTVPRAFSLSGNVANGSGNLAFWILSSGLNTGDPIYNVPSPTINRTDTESFAGALRQVIHLNLIQARGNIQLNWAWDQATGVLLSFDSNVVLNSGISNSFGYSIAAMTWTNLWPTLTVGDFGMTANPTSLIIRKTSINDPFALAISTITLTSLNGFSGTVALAATPTGFLGENFSSTQVNLTANSSAYASLILGGANSPPGTYFVTVTGTSGSISHFVTLTVQVVVQPDFQLFISIPPGGNIVFAGGSTSVGVQLFSTSTSSFNGTVTLTGQVSPFVSDGPTLSFNPTQISFAPTGAPFSQLTISTTASTRPGNYTITVMGESGTLVHTFQLELTVLPQPVLTLSPTSGPVGTQVKVHGSGFLNPSQDRFFPVELQITFDDQLVGFFFLQGSSFNFTFNVPDAQAGIIHQVHAKELFPSSLDVQASFLVLPEPSTLTVSVSAGTIYFPGDTAIIFATTNLNGQLTAVTSLQMILVGPNGSNITLNAVLVTPGVYKASYVIPSNGSIGTYGVIVKAHQTGLSDGSALASFEVKPTWLQANGRNVITATSIVGAVGTVGVVALAWRKGYFTRRKDEFPIP